MADILIVEDEKDLASAYQTILSTAHHDVRVAFNGDEALQRIAEREPDVILLDMQMPKLGGMGVLKGLEAKPLKHTHIIIFSNLDRQADIDEAFKLGAHRYLLKSWASPQELVRVVDEVLG